MEECQKVNMSYYLGLVVAILRNRSLGEQQNDEETSPADFLELFVFKYVIGKQCCGFQLMTMTPHLQSWTKEILPILE